MKKRKGYNNYQPHRSERISRYFVWVVIRDSPFFFPFSLVLSYSEGSLQESHHPISLVIGDAALGIARRWEKGTKNRVLLEHRLDKQQKLPHDQKEITILSGKKTHHPLTGLCLCKFWPLGLREMRLRAE